jgi:hypothetical protein
VYFGNMDDVLRGIASNVPVADTEHIYLWELNTQRRIYIAVVLLGIVMALFGMLLRIGV